MAGPIVVRGYTTLGGKRVGTFLRKRPVPGMAPTFTTRMGSLRAAGGPDPTFRAQDYLYAGRKSTRLRGRVTQFTAQRVSSLGHRTVGLKFDTLNADTRRSMQTFAWTNRTGGGPGGRTGGRAYYHVTPSSQRRIVSLASRMRVAAGGRAFNASIRPY